MTQITIRPLQVTDAAPLCQILNDIIAAGDTTAYEDLFDTQGFVAEFMGDGIVSSLVAVTDRPVGFQVLIAYGPDRPGVLAIASFADQIEKVPGVGRALFAETLKAAQQLGAEQIIAKVRADNRPGLRFYTGRGFQPIDVVPAVPLADGTPVDRIIHRLMVPQG